MATAVGRSALDVEDDTSLTTFLDDSSSSASSQARCRRTCKRWRCCKITCIVLVALLVLLGIVVGINISQRSALLEPMLQLLFEGNGVNGVVTFILHMCDYVEYKLTGRNIGPLGTSKHTDRSPLLIQLPVAMKKQECPGGFHR